VPQADAIANEQLTAMNDDEARETIYTLPVVKLKQNQKTLVDSVSPGSEQVTSEKQPKSKVSPIAR
jgi:hypothetical protein